MGRLFRSSLCLYCNLSFAQDNHDHCLTRLRHLKLEDGGRVVGSHITFLTGRYKKLPVKTCWCGVEHRWLSRDCHAHTRKWCNRYGGRVRTRHSRNAHLRQKRPIAEPTLAA